MNDRVGIHEAIAEFGNRVIGLDTTLSPRMPVKALIDKQSALYNDWATFSGVYVFDIDREIVYVGRALPGTGLRARVHNQCNSRGDLSWDAVLDHTNVFDSVIPLPASDWFWAASLEAYLIAQCKPR